MTGASRRGSQAETSDNQRVLGGSKASHSQKGSGKTPPSRKTGKSGFAITKGRDNSIQTYGNPATGQERAAAVAAMRSFFRAMATASYRAVCGMVDETVLKQAKALLKAKGTAGNCETLLTEIVPPSMLHEARRSAKGLIYQVRINEGNAFVLFTPINGPASYYVLKREDGRWKATNLEGGAPLR